MIPFKFSSFIILLSSDIDLSGSLSGMVPKPWYLSGRLLTASAISSFTSLQALNAISIGSLSLSSCGLRDNNCVSTSASSIRAIRSLYGVQYSGVLITFFRFPVVSIVLPSLFRSIFVPYHSSLFS